MKFESAAILRIMKIMGPIFETRNNTTTSYSVRLSITETYRTGIAFFFSRVPVFCGFKTTECTRSFTGARRLDSFFFFFFFFFFFLHFHPFEDPYDMFVQLFYL